MPNPSPNVFVRDAQRDETPALSVFELPNRFVKAGFDKDAPEDRALYLLPECTKGDPERELYNIMPFMCSKVGSYQIGQL